MIAKCWEKREKDRKTMTELEIRIYRTVAGIPSGQVMSYGQVAEACGNKNLCRVVGNTMHKNPVPFVELARECGYEGDFVIDPEREKEFRELGIERVPCHRVVDSKGAMGKNFGLGGPGVQEKMLRSEGFAEPHSVTL